MAQIGEEELERRRKMFRESTISAGPDDPIYRSGLRMTCVHKADDKPRRVGRHGPYPKDF
jgi:hypothetical protein